jgi:hypothetical protein
MPTRRARGPSAKTTARQSSPEYLSLAPPFAILECLIHLVAVSVFSTVLPSLAVLCKVTPTA